ncbi:sigma-70 family RNA polymerase sigma factor [Rossellomorea aquimaris]|uniref:sigma-70 family RNA polymerase sigma factor n=1 Tax=Rossellomorea aquimaris TaxID=189382 RepID=UPI001CD72903|nr:sigma-70 family RNA polymerase sigma factor [Rossellomorea aquimaris]MCA1055756.1 sigma-70 family RNA polymerase sigma factor [Rossellomorea aquimaris]
MSESRKVPLYDQNGLDEFYERFFDEMRPKVMKLAFSYVKDHRTSEDITQEVFLKCYKNIGTFRGDASISTWIYSITANVCKDHLRSYTVRNIICDDTLMERTSHPESVLNQLLEEDERQWLKRVVTTLPAKYSEIIQLYYFEELTIHQIATSLQINENTTRTRLRRAREALRCELEADLNRY